MMTIKELIAERMKNPRSAAAIQRARERLNERKRSIANSTESSGSKSAEDCGGDSQRASCEGDEF